MTAPLFALDYFLGFGVFGFVYWLLNGILVEFRSISMTGAVYDYANYFWVGSLVVYMVFGAFWLPRKLKEWKYFNGGL